MAETDGRRKVAVAIVLVALAGAATLVLPRLGPRGTDAPLAPPDTVRGTKTVLAGDVTSARKKIDPGKSEKAILDLIGKPSVAVETKGAERHSIWTYDYADGNLTLNLTDGYLVRVDTEYGPSTRGLKRE